MASLEQSIRKLIHKYNKHPQNSTKLEKDCVQCARHANHILKTLVAKRTSLGYAVQAFGEACDNYIEVFKKKCGKNEGERRMLVLTKWFTHFLRLRDGFQLMESGERRHKHDDDVDGTGTRFKSRLSGALRRDGVTRKFKSALGYTGFGWDEFYDDDVGIKKQLLETLVELTGKQRAAENIISIWEENMDNHETERKLLSDQLASTFKSFVDKMNQLLASKGEAKLKLVTDDKAEKLTWGLLDLKRSGNRFTIESAGGSIPIAMTLGQWREMFALPETVTQHKENHLPNEATIKSTKKRRVIEDSSDEEDEAPVEKHAAKQLPPRDVNGSSSGIEVKIRQKAKLPVDNLSSLDEIKRLHGVSARHLEDARSQIHQENVASSMAAYNDELRELVGDGDALNQCIHQWGRLQTYRSEFPHLYEEMEDISDELKEKMSRWKLCQGYFESKSLKEHEPDELFTLREKYREASMELGNFILDTVHVMFLDQLQQLNQNDNGCVSLRKELKENLLDSAYIFLQAAGGFYKQALALVKDQLLFYSKPDMSIGKQWEKTQQLLLRGRAQFNIGLTKLELSQCSSSLNENVKEFVSDACKYFDDATTSCSSIRHNTLIIRNHSKSNEMSEQDNSKTWKDQAMLQILESTWLLIRSQKGNCECLWKLRRFDEAEAKMIKAADTSDIIELDGIKEVDIFWIVRLLCDLQLVPCSLLDMAANTLDDTPSKDTTAGDKLLKILRKAVQLATDISIALHAVAEKDSIGEDDKFILIIKDLVTVESLKAEEKEIAETWASKTRTASKEKMINQHSIINNDQDRGELRQDLQSVPLRPDRERILLLEGRPSSRRRKNIQKNNARARVATAHLFQSAFGPSGSGASTSNVNDDSSKQKYMPWGDEVLRDHDLNKYPACCPPLPSEMPLEIRRALESKLGDILPN